MTKVKKFRVWDNYKSYFFHFDLNKPFFDDNLNQVTFGCSNIIGDHDDGGRFVVSEFTGLKDKKNKDIYELDLLKSYPESTEVYTVYWEADEGRWNLKGKDGWDYDNGDYYVGLFYRCWKNFEVVGNIYENQDLLK